MDGLTTSEIFILSIAFVLTIAIFFIGGIGSTGLLVGLLSSLGSSILLIKMQDSASAFGKKIWNWLLNHKVLADVIASIVFVVFLNPATVTGLIAGVSAVIYSSALLILMDKGVGKVQLSSEDEKTSLSGSLKQVFAFKANMEPACVS